MSLINRDRPASAATQTMPERIYHANDTRPVHIVEEKLSRRGIDGTVGYFTTRHKGAFGSPYQLVRQVVLCGRCRLTKFVVHFNRAGNMHLRSPASACVPEESQCQCEPTSGS